MRPVVEFHDKGQCTCVDRVGWRHYTVNGNEGDWTPERPHGRVASVTQILGVLDKSGPLVGWAVNVTCEGAFRILDKRKDPEVVRLVVEGLRADAEKARSDRWKGYLLGRAERIEAGGYRLPSNWRQFQRELGFAKLDHHHTVGEAQLRGTTVHEIGEAWALEKKLPKLAEHPAEWHGYIRAMAGFLRSIADEEFESAEVLVGSAVHGYAGTCDTVTVARAQNGVRRRRDYKTSKQVYPSSHFRQLEGYEHAAVEMGDEPTDARSIVCLYEDGTFEECPVPPEHMGPRAFLNTLAVFRDEQPLKRLGDEAYRARKARERKAKEAK